MGEDSRPKAVRSRGTQLPLACLTVEINLRCAVGIIVLVCLHAYLDIATQGVDLCACILPGRANNFRAVGSKADLLREEPLQNMGHI